MVIRVLPIIIAVEELPFDRTLRLVGQLRNRVGYKVHSDVDREGAKAIVGLLQDAGADRVMVDLKFHDTKNTVVRRARELRYAGADIITIHASGGREMMHEAVIEAGEAINAITVLTSLDDEECKEIYGAPRAEKVLQFATIAAECGVSGVVCSPNEVALLKGNDKTRHLKLRVPGSRSVGVAAGGQKNIQTPLAVLQAGAEDLVIGRQVTEADDPLQALELIAEEIAPALAMRGGAS